MNFTNNFNPHSKSGKVQIIPHIAKNSQKAHSLILVTDVAANRTTSPTTSTQCDLSFLSS